MSFGWQPHFFCFSQYFLNESMKSCVDFCSFFMFSFKTSIALSCFAILCESSNFVCQNLRSSLLSTSCSDSGTRMLSELSSFSFLNSVILLTRWFLALGIISSHFIIMSMKSLVMSKIVYVLFNITFWWSQKLSKQWRESCLTCLNYVTFNESFSAYQQQVKNAPLIRSFSLIARCQMILYSSPDTLFTIEILCLATAKQK